MIFHAGGIMALKNEELMFIVGLWLIIMVKLGMN
jgi:hypothetical protein